jgi:hypothetical protein
MVAFESVRHGYFLFSLGQALHGREHKNLKLANRVVQYSHIWEYFAPCAFRSGMSKYSLE